MPVPTLTFLLTWGMAQFEESYQELNADQRKQRLIAQARAALPAMAGQPVDAVLYAYLFNEWETAGAAMPAEMPFAMESE